MILLLNGAFGIGKTTVARVLVRRLPRAVLFNPEFIGSALQRSLRLFGGGVYDFQDLKCWRRLTIVALRLARRIFPIVVVPMAFSSTEYLREISRGISRFEPVIFHFCLVAPIDVVERRLRQRGEDPARTPRPFERAYQCCIAHESIEFARHVDAVRDVDVIANEIVQYVCSAR